MSDKEKSGENELYVLNFKLGKSLYGIDINIAKEVVSKFDVTYIPKTPSFILGAINLHGEIVTVFDIRYFLGLEDAKLSDDVKVIIIDMDGNHIGIAVDDIMETRALDVSEVQEPPVALQGDALDYVVGQVHLDDDILVLLNLEKMLNIEKIRVLKGEE